MRPVVPAEVNTGTGNGNNNPLFYHSQMFFGLCRCWLPHFLLCKGKQRLSHARSHLLICKHWPRYPRQASGPGAAAMHSVGFSPRGTAGACETLLKRRRHQSRFAAEIQPRSKPMKRTGSEVFHWSHKAFQGLVFSCYSGDTDFE